MPTSTTVLKLSRLPKADGLRSLNYKRTTPGTFNRLLFPRLGFGPPLKKNHPLSRTNPEEYIALLPKYKSKLFKVSVFPKALLAKPDVQFPDAPPFTRSKCKAKAQSETRIDDKGLALETGDHALENVIQRQKDVSVLFYLSKKSLHSSSVVRQRIKMRIKAALSLAVTRQNMNIEKVASSPKSTSVGDSSLQQFNFEDWTIVIHPTLRAYRAPVEDLIRDVREALEVTGPHIASLDAIWSDKPISHRQLLSRMKDQVPQKSLQSMQSTPAQEVSRDKPTRPTRYVYEEIEDLLLEGDSEEPLLKLSVEEKRARLLEKGVQKALFASRPIIQPLTLDDGREQKGREPKGYRRTKKI